MMNERAYEHTKYFVEECGIRVAGTESVIKGSDYILDYYKKNGIKTETHEFDVPVCEILKSQLKVREKGDWVSLNHTPALFSRSTKPGGVTLPLVYVEDGSVANLRSGDVKGKAVLICRDAYMVYPDIKMYKRLKEFDVAAVIYTSGEGHWDVPYVYANFETMDEDYTIPTAVIHSSTAKEIVLNNVSEVFLDIQFNVSLKKSRNTLGIIKGSKYPEQSVVVCAHLDSTVGSTGAVDDATGVAVVMELARYYQELANKGIRPDRTIRFIAWSGHECGIHGSKFYLLDHPHIFDNISFVLNFDGIGSVLSNYSAVGGCTPKIEAKLNEITRSLDLDWPIVMEPAVVDALNFAAKEIVHITLFAGVGCGCHTKYDTMDLVSAAGFNSPFIFSKAVIDWAVGEDKIEHGFPPELAEALKETSKMYGWGLFGLV
ncbi:M28 family peptidase [Eubacteriales bacterium DFI.9.88]|nr:M28 family peptidase [Eubacteriales bacterium DFI.9.88]